MIRSTVRGQMYPHRFLSCAFIQICLSNKDGIRNIVVRATNPEQFMYSGNRPGFQFLTFSRQFFLWISHNSPPLCRSERAVVNSRRKALAIDCPQNHREHPLSLRISRDHHLFNGYHIRRLSINQAIDCSYHIMKSLICILISVQVDGRVVCEVAIFIDCISSIRRASIKTQQFQFNLYTPYDILLCEREYKS